MEQPLTKEESYADRRLLFKDIWDTAINIEETKKNVHKPKVIKTLRLNEQDRCKVGKKKKQRIRKLRIVCNKLLDLCDRQDEDARFYEQMATKDKESLKDWRPKTKITKVRKVKKVKRMFTPIRDATETGTTSPDKFLELNVSTRSSSPPKIKGTAQSVQEKYRERGKRQRIQNYSGVRMLIRASRECSNKRLFPINKINIT